jgi:glycosyltransferase involved in cell wall biosynthesis
MRIAVNSTHHLHGGSMTHLQNLLKAWTRAGVDREHEISLFIRAESIDAIEKSVTGQIDVKVVGGLKFSGVAKLAWEQSILPRRLKQSGTDVLLCTGNIAPMMSAVPSVVMFRHMGPFCESVSRETVSRNEWLWLRALGAMMRLSGKAATRVIFLSHYFKDIYVQGFGFPPERADVIYHGKDSLRFGTSVPSALEPLGVRPPYILSVAHLDPFRNFPELIQGYALAKPGLPDNTQLVLAGLSSSDAYQRRLQGLVRKHRLEDSVVMTGGVPHEMVGALLDHCDSFVFTSTCENCPNSLIEALSAGVPIACSNAGVMPEIAGDAVLYFDPNDPQDISRVLKRIRVDSALRDSLRVKSRTESLKFPTWDEVGRLTLDSLVRAAEDR